MTPIDVQYKKFASVRDRTVNGPHLRSPRLRLEGRGLHRTYRWQCDAAALCSVRCSKGNGGHTSCCLTLKHHRSNKNDVHREDTGTSETMTSQMT